MGEPRRLYAVYMAELCSVEIARETPLYFYAVRSSPATDWSIRVAKVRACLTPESAWVAHLKKFRNNVDVYAMRLAEARAALETVEVAHIAWRKAQS